MGRAKRADNTEKRKLIIFLSCLIPIYGLKVVKFEELKVKRLVTLQEEALQINSKCQHPFE